MPIQVKMPDGRQGDDEDHEIAEDTERREIIHQRAPIASFSPVRSHSRVAHCKEGDDADAGPYDEKGTEGPDHDAHVLALEEYALVEA